MTRVSLLLLFDEAEEAEGAIVGALERRVTVAEERVMFTEASRWVRLVMLLAAA